MPRARLCAWTACGAAVLLVLSGCAGSESAQPEDVTPPLSRTIVFREAVTVPVWVGDGRARRGVISARLVNEGDSTVSIVAVEPIVDDGLRAEYLGYSTCLRGCAGALEWDVEAAERVRNGLDGRLPIELVPLSELQATGGRAFSLTFRLGARDATGVSALAERCLHLRGLVATLDDGSRVKVTAPDGHFVGAAVRAEPTPSGYQYCDES
jgi:hypothetical protein